MCRASSRPFRATLLLFHVSCISIGIAGVGAGTGVGDLTTRSGNEWRPPEPERWSPLASLADSSLTSLTGPLDPRPAQNQRPAVQEPPGDGGAGDTVPGTNTHPRTRMASSEPSVHQRPPSGWLKSFEGAEKHFLFRRDLSKTQDAPPRFAPPSDAIGWTWADNRTGSGPICHGSTESMDGSCNTSRGRAPGPVLMTKASNSNGTEDFPGSNRTAAPNNASAFLALGELELATLQSPLEEENHTAHYYTVVNLDNHNDVLCDDEYQMEYNENCFIDHNVTCVGDPDFCNLTYDEYRQLLMDYIYPSTGEWILIASHTVVFIMGLTSHRNIPLKYNDVNYATLL
ncbi:AGAP004783-PA-like protein [Anopheles sinensis]|uniref:AGAP004783-PA-like protein n=1 Tax=Anopheles sinensis TaxID=74873 RepID=A0A084W9R8_ANOSI|nr:AGAP004783-PA-like protein [Anopheles sinensis]